MNNNRRQSGLTYSFISFQDYCARDLLSHSALLTLQAERRHYTNIRNRRKAARTNNPHNHPQP